MDGNAAQYGSSHVERLPGSRLAGKRVLFLGSSVTFGSASEEDAIPEYFERRFGCVATKEAVSGTTLADVDGGSYVNRLRTKVDIGTDYSLAVCQLSTNDAARGIPLGSAAPEGCRTYDTKTVTGAIEYIVSYMCAHWDCDALFYTGSRFESPAYQAMVDRLYELRRKWPRLGVLDLWSDPAFNAIPDEVRRLYMADDVHPKKAGYMKWWCPELERQLAAYEARRTPVR